MTRPGSLSRRKLIRLMRAFDYEGPFSGGGRSPHDVMVRGRRTVPIPNPHGDDPSWSLVREILRQADIDETEALRELGCG